MPPRQPQLRRTRDRKPQPHAQASKSVRPQPGTRRWMIPPTRTALEAGDQGWPQAFA